MSATATRRMRWCSFPMRRGRWEPTPAVPGLQTAPGLIVYRYGADLFYANADRFADQVRELVEKAPEPVKWFVVDAEAIGDMDLSAAQTVRSAARRPLPQGRPRRLRARQPVPAVGHEAAPHRRGGRRRSNLPVPPRGARRHPRRRLVARMRLTPMSKGSDPRTEGTNIRAAQAFLVLFCRAREDARWRKRGK